MKIKRLYLFMLQSFVPLFVMTFFICLFIVLMQFLWRYIDDLVGKGLEISVIAELFFYAALTMIPMALPLAILLASLMTFGNLGERFELTAMKASGVSLIKCMRPLIVLMAGIAIAAFFFQNNVLPVGQTKMYTLLLSMKQKSPELEIPEGVFYDQIPGFNLFVKEKDHDTGTLRQIMIYDMSKGFDNAAIILADSGRLAMTEDKTHLFLTLWSGESFENLTEAAGRNTNVPYRRESFSNKEILLKFDANFNRMDEEGMRNQYVGKNISQLQASIDSLSARVDSIGTSYAALAAGEPFMGLTNTRTVLDDNNERVTERVPDVSMNQPLNVDSIFRGSSSGYRLTYLNAALTRARRQKQDYEFKGLTISEERRIVRRHAIEMHKKFTLSFACIIFFFIGAPLGAIIRKGGLGMPLVISVFLFIFYYIIDNTGFKLARDGRWDIWEGMWLSSLVLLPLGIFFTYKAVNDSAVFNRDAYANFLRKLIGKREQRHVEMKEVVMDEMVKTEALEKLGQLVENARRFLNTSPERQSYTDYWLHGYSRTALKTLAADEEDTVHYLSNSRDKKVIGMLDFFPILRSLWLYHPTGLQWVGWIAIVIFPIGLPLWLAGRDAQRRLRKEIMTVADTAQRIIGILNEKIETKQ